MTCRVRISSLDATALRAAVLRFLESLNDHGQPFVPEQDELEPVPDGTRGAQWRLSPIPHLNIFHST